MAKNTQSLCDLSSKLFWKGVVVMSTIVFTSLIKILKPLILIQRGGHNTLTSVSFDFKFFL